ncbi:MAG: HAD family hydrolase [Clostridiales bacterium]|nr:HAD family hydrolase [Clostridiales bacterium]
MSKYDLVIFDFDGTLADTRNIIVAAKQETIRRHGLPFRDEAACAATIGLSATAGFLVLYEDMDEATAEELTKEYRALFEEYRTKMPPEIFPHVEETLQKLSEAGVFLTVASSRNTPSLLGFLRTMDLMKYFSLVLGSDDTKLLKPEPEPVLETFRRMEGLSKNGGSQYHDLRRVLCGERAFPAANALVVGDMPFDIKMGKNAGADAVGVTYGNASQKELLESGADYIIDDMADLYKIVMEG